METRFVLVNLNAHKTWAVKLSQELNKIENVNNSFVVQNAGVNGNTTRQALLRIHYDVISHNPMIFNDSVRNE